ncbi:LLM class flavin-dependent oxidoreductase [Labrys monachus]|uniref:LLM family oxidoreductase n=1 Tax=Labrys monachus TaxID=217067 RepID=A0ABU0FBU8_9HYPH|nr:LLM class flavin-dependent oxidoreductase [Labrys monachus]MDQ0391530.1 putative LLM family oxidoreductase [Labrys monachus]
MELGLYTFAETTADPATGAVIGAQERFANLMEEAELADQVGLDVFGIGEHHRPDFAASAPAVLLAAAAMRTKRIRLTSAVTVLSSDDPVRVFQEFSTVDLLSGGRAEILAGRGSFIESFPLFGYDLADYDSLFSEKLDLLLRLRERTTLNWEGKHRAPLHEQSVYPRPVQQPLPVWVGVGGNPSSVVRAATLGLPMALAIIGGEPARFKPLVDLYREAARRAGHDPATLPVSINSHGFIDDDGDAAAETIYPYYVDVMGRLGRERGWGPYSRAQFEAQRSPRGSDFIGDPQQVIDKILAEHELFHHQRFLIKFSMGSVPHARLMRAIELFGTVVAPAVRKALAP